MSTLGTVKGKPTGYFSKLLALDCESSGIALNSPDPSFDAKNNKEYQSLSWGFVVADQETLLPIEELYLEIKPDPNCVWDPKAFKVHKLSREHLEKNGLTIQDAIVKIGDMIIRHWGPDGNIRLLGHNVATFDQWFLKRLMRKEGIELKFGNRMIDTSSIGFGTFGTFTSDQFFEATGLHTRGTHNALEDAKYALEAARRTRVAFQTQVLGN